MNVVRYAITAVLLVGAAVLLIWGPRNDNALPTDRVVVEYWEKWTGREGDAVRAVIKDYNDGQGKLDGVYVNCLTTSEIAKKTLVATASGTPPDIAGLWDYNLVQYAALNAIEPLDGLIQESDYKPVYWKMCTWDGHLYALVSTPATIALHYHKKIFADNAEKLRAAGLDPNRPPETIEEFDAYSKVLDLIEADGTVLRAGSVPQVPGSWLRYISMWWGKEIWDEKTGQFQLTDPKVVEAFDWIASYSRKLGKAPTAKFVSGVGTGTVASPDNAFFFDPTKAGAYPRVVMEMQGPWMSNFIYNFDPKISELRWPRVLNERGEKVISDDEWSQDMANRRSNYEWAVAPFPSAVGLKDTTYATCDILVIPKGAKHKEEAKRFLKWFNSQQPMEKLCLLHSKNSPLASVSAEFIARHTNPYVEAFERLASSPNAFTTPKLPINQETTDELKAVAESVALLREPAAEALAHAQKRLQAKYDDFLERQRLRKAAGAGGTGTIGGGER